MGTRPGGERGKALIRYHIAVTVLLGAGALLLPAPGRAQGTVMVELDYFGHRLLASCPVRPESGSAASFQELVSRDAVEVGPCVAELVQRVAPQYGLTGYAEVLLLERFVARLPAAESDADKYTSFAPAALQGRPLARRDRIALLYALLSSAGYGVGMMESEGYYFLVLRVGEEISGHWWEREDWYAWEPGRPFSDAGTAAGFSSAVKVTAHDGRAVEFILPDLPWERTAAGERKQLQAPAGCPRAWDRSIVRRPELERYLDLWPRDRMVQAKNAATVLAAFGFRDLLRPYGALARMESPLRRLGLVGRLGPAGRGWGEEALGNCLLQYEVLNLDYDWKHAQEEGSLTRHPAATLFLGGDCDELCFTLIGLLRLAGFPQERMVMLRYEAGSPDAHMNLGVAPAGGKLPSGSFVEAAGRRYYIMDPAYKYLSNNRVATVWGLLPDKYKGREAQILPLK